MTFVLPDGGRVELDGYGRLNLLAHAEMIELELPQKCGGQAECGTCRVRVLEGEVTPPTPDERDLSERHARRFADGERLACRARPRGDVVAELLALTPPDLRDA
ncbi:MAG: hypothetical protein CSA66_02075 [Proteobacteria bacterium]|nr:MAG: hypothetical protein CSA66_02075 [Pseudomonadota bacterium]